MHTCQHFAIIFRLSKPSQRFDLVEEWEQEEDHIYRECVCECWQHVRHIRDAYLYWPWQPCLCCMRATRGPSATLHRLSIRKKYTSLSLQMDFFFFFAHMRLQC